MVKQPIIVAEMTINHLGMVKILKQMISSAKEAGANYVKLKLKNVDDYYQDESKSWRNLKFKDYRSSLELRPSDFLEIDKYCKEIGIKWFCTVHDLQGLEFLQQFDLPFYKVASIDSDKEEIINEVLSICKSKNKPMVVSLGGKSQEFAENIIEKITKKGIELYVLHAVSLYPTPTGKSNIQYLAELKRRFSKNSLVHFGYSGHEEGYGATILAAMYGAVMIERHFTLSYEFKIHHLKTALLPSDFASMIRLINDIRLELGSESTDFLEDENRFLKNLDYNDYSG